MVRRFTAALSHALLGQEVTAARRCSQTAPLYSLLNPRALLFTTGRSQPCLPTPSLHRHFQGISPRLVEMYRLRAETAHWSLRPDQPLGQLLSRMGSRRVSMDMVRPMGLVRQTVAAAAAAANAADIAAANAAAGEPLLPGLGSSDGMRRAEGSTSGGRVGAKVAGLKRSLSRLGLVLAEKVGKGGRGGKGAGGGDAEDPTVFAILDPNYDHPPMIGEACWRREGEEGSWVTAELRVREPEPSRACGDRCRWRPASNLVHTL